SFVMSEHQHLGRLRLNSTLLHLHVHSGPLDHVNREASFENADMARLLPLHEIRFTNDGPLTLLAPLGPKYICGAEPGGGPAADPPGSTQPSDSAPARRRPVRTGTRNAPPDGIGRRSSRPTRNPLGP